MGRHRRTRHRPRYGRVLAAFASVTVTVTAALGGLGALPTTITDTGAAAGAIGGASDRSASDAAAGTGQGTGDDSDSTDQGAGTTKARTSGRSARVGVRVADRLVIEAATDDLPADSGAGRRVVFSQEDQRVWLVEADGTVARTYPVSGSIYDNLDPGTYSVFSRSEQAWGIDDSGTMKWFVRFAHGPNAAIGFHDIPVAGGAPVQSTDDLGTPLSHGCIRQRTADARAMWDFAPIGTKVVVV